MTWSNALANYLQLYNRDQLVLLMLDDYGLCGSANIAAIREVEGFMLANPSIGNVHLTWQPPNPKTPLGPLLELPAWSYSVNTQAAIRRRDLLLAATQTCRDCQIEAFELAGSQWFNERRHGPDRHCQTAMPEPENPSAFVDETDKENWALPYHNIMRRGTPDPRHASFLAANGLGPL